LPPAAWLRHLFNAIAARFPRGLRRDWTAVLELGGEDYGVCQEMVVSAVEESCLKNGLDRVTVEELERIRARMPTPKIFG
jgi:hypothetical protein